MKFLIETLNDEVLDLLFKVWYSSGTQMAFEYWVEVEYYPGWYTDNKCRTVD